MKIKVINVEQENRLEVCSIITTMGSQTLDNGADYLARLAYRACLLYYLLSLLIKIRKCLFVVLFVCSRFSWPFRNRLGYPWHKVSFRWDSESEWDSELESGSQTGSQSGSESGCELEEESE